MKKLDNKGWKKVRFGEVCRNLNVTVKSPEQNGYDKVIGLENIESGSLHIKTWGNLADGTTFTKTFEPGHVLFGKRRAYLKKAAVAEFKGLCSGDILVFEAIENVLHPKLLPFIVSSDRFFDFAVKTSAGSLSPRTKFQDLANFEFSLPPIDQQEKIAELLWAGDDLIEKETKLLLNYGSFYQSLLNDLIHPNIEDASKYNLGQLGQTFGGLSGKTKLDFGRGKPFITYMNVFKNSKIDINEIDLCEIKPGEKQNQLKYGDIVFTGSSETPEEVGMASVLLDKSIDDIYLNSFCFAFRLDSFDVILPEFARFLFRAQYVRDFMHLHAQGSTRFNLSKTTVKEKLNLFIPSKEKQKEIVSRLEKLLDLEMSLISKSSQVKNILHQIINNVIN